MCSSILDFFGFGYCLFDRGTGEERDGILPKETHTSVFQNDGKQTPVQECITYRHELDIAREAYRQLKDDKGVSKEQVRDARLRCESFQRQLDKLQHAHPDLIHMVPF
jgi:hypothetical protein